MKHKLILGTAQIGLNYGINNFQGKIILEDALSILKYAYDERISYLDTAEAYGDAHLIIGEYHKQNPDSKFRIITKVPKSNTQSLFLKVEEYIEQLAVEFIDVLMFHSFETFVNNFDKNKNEILDLKQKGLIKQSGVSIYTNDQFEQVIDTDWIDVIQLPFNLFDNKLKRGELIKRAKEKNKIIHTRSAFLQGIFFMDRNHTNNVVRELQSYLYTIDNICNKEKISMSTLALTYCLNQAEIDNVLIGIDNLKQLQQNIEDSEAILPSNIINIIDMINIENDELLNPSLW